jgi:hypothetical protein
MLKRWLQNSLKEVIRDFSSKLGLVPAPPPSPTFPPLHPLPNLLSLSLSSLTSSHYMITPEIRRELFALQGGGPGGRDSMAAAAGSARLANTSHRLEQLMGV